MSREQANTFKQHRDANDPQGNLGWSARMAKKAMRIAPEAPPDVETAFELSEEECVLWRLLKLPRRYLDLENAGLLPTDKVRGFMRGLVSADVIDVLEDEQAKPIVPVELVRLKKELRGEKIEKPSSGRLRPRVYRPDIGGAPSTSPPPPSRAPSPAAPPASKPASAPSTPPSSSTARPSAEDAALKKRIEDAHAKMREQSLYEFLGVAKSAGHAEIKQSYVKLAREYHPDVVAGRTLAGDADLAKKLDALFGRLQDANRVLSNAQERLRYDDKLAKDPKSGGMGEAGKKVRRPEEAHVLLKKAEHLLRVKDYAPAERHFKIALELDDQNPDIQLGYGWCVYLNPQRPKDERMAEAKAILTPLADQKSQAEAAWKLALIAGAEGHESEHIKRLHQTLKLNPRHADAGREKRLLDMRKRKTEDEKKPKGILDKLIKR